MTITEIATELKKIDNALIFCHMRPDGDTIGSGLALSFALKKLNIKNKVICESDIPEKFFFIKGANSFEKDTCENFTNYIAVDCSDEMRMGNLSDKFQKAKVTKFNIDHHISNTFFAKYNFVEECSATCQLMTQIILAMGVELDENISNALMLGICTDTGNFAHKNVTSETLEMASVLLKGGADLNKISYNMFKLQSKERAKVYGISMSRIRFELDDKLAIVYVTLEDLQKAGAKSDVTEGFIDFPLSISGVEVALCFLQTKPNTFKVSLRSNGKADVNKIASTYGGGGHILASGCMLQGSLEEVIDKLTYTVKQHLE